MQPPYQFSTSKKHFYKEKKDMFPSKTLATPQMPTVKKPD
jgi:hypothetical protein